MKLQGRNLSIEMQGEDVKLLHTELHQIDYTIPDEEVQKTFFGRVTQQVVLEFQKAEGLETTGIVDEKTAERINAKVDAQNSRKYFLRGQVTQFNGTTSTAFPEAKVRAYDLDRNNRNLLGETVTNERGYYEITYTDDQFRRSDNERDGANLIVWVLNNEEQLLATSKLKNNAQSEETIDLIVPVVESAPQEEKFVVKGTIHQADGSVAVGVTVVAFDKDLRSEQALGKVGTDTEGRYQIQYTAEQFQRLEKKTADLIVRVFGKDETQVAASPIIFNAAPIEIVDLVIGGGEYRGLSEYERLMAELTPLLGEIPLADLKEDKEFQDVTFLTGETEIKPQLIAFLILAARHSRTTNVPPEAFYGLFRQNLPTNLPALLLVSPQVQRSALETAIQKNTIPASFSAQIEKILETLQALIGKQVLDPANNTQPFLFGQLLDTLGISRDKQETFLKSYINHQGRIQDFWQSLRQNPAFQGNNQVESLQFTLQLGILTQNHIPLVNELQTMRTNGFLNSPKDLVKLDEAAWTTLIQKQVNGKAVGLPPDVLGETEAEKTRNYVNAMMGLVEKAFPTPAIAHRVSQDNRPEKAHLRQFLTNNSDFEFANTHIDTYLTNARGIPGNPPERDALTKQLKTMQRVFQVAPKYEHMEALIASGLDSAYRISHTPDKTLADVIGAQLDGVKKVRAIKSRAKMVNAKNTTTYTAIHQEFNDVRLAVIDNGKQGDTLKQNPNLTTLFGSLDLCDCKHCRSVYSPAAYFVDIMHSLEKSGKNKAGKTPLDVLLQRRPDLEHILLTCENTNTPLPYIDLVNEILEYYVASNKLDATTAKNTIDITAEELSVNPQYTIDTAYTNLKDAVYPLSLPFNRPIEVARTYLEHLGSSRYQVMDTFKGSSGPSEEAIACEYLNISSQERQVLLGVALQPSKQLWEFYGYSSATVSNQDWKVHLAQVPEFLNQTRISYLDLIELLKTRFLNPNKGTDAEITLYTPDDKDPCDLNNVTIKPLDDTDTTLQKMHRFIRLWRKLGWEIRDLDKVIQALGANDINDNDNDPFLSKLAQVKQLQTDLKLPLVQLLSFWANIDTHGEDTLYNKLFQNKAVLNPVDFDFKLDENSLELQLVVDAGNDSNKKPKISPPEVPNQKVPKNHIPAILAALRINAADLEAMRMDAGLDDRSNTNPPTFADLNLANLSKLYRLALLAKALKLSVKDLISLKTLTGIDPFSAPSETLKFVDKVHKVRQSHFSVAQLNYLYRHISESAGSIAPLQENIALLVKNLRDGLKKIADDNRLESDPTGELTRKKLGAIWESVLVDQFIPMLDGSATYSIKLNSFPDSLTFPVPNSVTSNIYYDPTTKQLQFLGEMTEDEKTLLLCFARDGKYQIAVNSLFQKSHVTTLASLPSIEFPDSLTNKISYNAVTKQLQFVGQMTEDEKTLLLGLSTEENYQNAVNSLQTQPATNLDSLPPIEPQSVNRKISYDATTQLLQFLDEMTDEEKTKLHSLSTNQNYQSAVEYLFNQSKSITNPTYEASLNSLPNKLTFPNSGNKISYNPTTQILQFVGTMTVSERTMLVSLSSNQGYLDAINNLFQQPRSFLSNTISNTNASFLKSADAIAQLLDSGTLNTEEKFAYVLTRLLPYLQDLLSRSLIKQTLSDALKLDSAMTELLLKALVKSRTDNSKPAIADFLALIDDSLSAELPPSYYLLHKIAILINTFKMTPKEVSYLSQHSADFAGFDLNVLPLDRANPTQTDTQAINLFKQWERLYQLFTLRDSLPQTEVTLIDVFTTASASTDPNQQLSQATTDKLIAATGWNTVEFSYLTDSQNGFNLNDVDFKNEIKILTLQACLSLTKRLGVSVKQLFNWATSEPDSTQAQDIIKTVKAKYEDEQWLIIAKPLSDRLRESQKSALIDYVLAKSEIQVLGISDSNQLFEYFLIDVDMCACMATSRIKQAISSVQLFVQRCLMNLENKDSNSSLRVKPDAIDDQDWKWMKNYRVWEANRKVFLYPENWIEPDLRDNKSPFFKEMESQLLQNDVTMDTAEQAFLNYLEKLDEVARLDICGMYWQEKEDKEDKTEILHVFGRTFNTPHIYYYRHLIVDTNVWTPWEKVNLDIEGDHLIPVVYNRRLYLFWPIFEEKPNEGQGLSNPLKESEAHKQWKRVDEAYKQWERDYANWHADSQRWEAVNNINGRSEFYPVNSPKQPAKPFAEPNYSENDPKGATTHLEIKLAWSEYKQNKWSPKLISLDPIKSSGEQLSKLILSKKSDYFFRTLVSEDYLNINVFLRSSPLKQYNWYGFFQSNGCRGKVYTIGGIKSPVEFNSLEKPKGSENVFMTFKAAYGITNLTLVDDKEILKKIPSSYSLLYPPTFKTPSHLFFYKDKQRTYSVMPKFDFTNVVLTTPEQFYPVWNIPFQDALDIEIKRPDVGDPAPLEQRINLPAIEGIQNKALSSRRFLSSTESRTKFSSASELTIADGTPQEMIPKDSNNSSEIASKEIFDTYNFAYLQDILIYGQTYLKFSTFYHPHVCAWIKALNRKGIPELLTLHNQQFGKNDQPPHTVFQLEYQPTDQVHWDYPLEDVNFNNSGAYSLYNWEVFFHAPLIIATHLSQNQRFEEAQKWFHYIFNPTDSSPDPSPQRYWKVLPFYKNSSPENDRIQELLVLLSYENNPQDKDNQEKLKRKADVEDQVKQWSDNPFNPHLIARLRITAYQKTVVMKYIDNLIAWADQLFSRDTIESINEATQLYILAYNMLGPRPERIPARDKSKPQTYAMLKDKLDSFSNKLVQMENEFPFSVSDSSSSNGSNSSGTGSLKLGTTFYFCIPKNDKLLEYWDTVADRLFKIRHCMNIEGMVRQLPLFEPPISPALLVRATAMGVDLSSALSDMNAALPHYRFSYMSQKALELCAELKSLGGALLSALEKKDAEKLSAIRASHETSMLKAVRQIKEKQIEEANETLVGLQKTKEMADIRYAYYTSRPFINQWEIAHLALSGEAAVLQAISEGIMAGAGAAHTGPTVYAGGAGSFGSPLTFSTVVSGEGIGDAIEAAAKVLSITAGLIREGAAISATMGSYQLRAEEWKFQANLAKKEKEQIDKQIAAANIRIAIAEKDLENHDLQIENATTIEEFLRDKYTNEELYNWMLSQISAIFFQSYKLAYDVAKRAERTYRFERGLTSSNFIQFGYWDSLRKGLLSGERLYLDLKRLEMAYLDQNKREYEIAKQISLVLHDPMALISLKETGLCEIVLPEALFDMDYPGHYMRRIKSVSLTIPCVTGPYTNINCTLTLLSNKIRTDNETSNSYEEDIEGDDPRFLTNFAAIQSIVTSSAQNDSGMFELNFRDERYLPFEGAGAVSRWRIDMPKDCNAFDFDSISDVIIKLNYTAREGGEILKKAAKQAVKNAIAGADKAPLARLFSAKHEFSTEWYRFLHPVDSTASSQKLELALTPERFHFQFRGKKIEISKVELFLNLKDGVKPGTDKTYTEIYTKGIPLDVLFTPPGGNTVQLQSSQSFLNGMPYAAIDNLSVEVESNTLWLFSANISQMLDAISDIIILCHYSVSG